MSRRSWDEVSIESELRVHATRLGRMPSANELRASGAGDLACAVSRRGGYFAWAKRIGEQLKGTETHRGQCWERSEADYFRSLGYVVAHQSTKAPFDLLVGSKRVDVKMGTRRTYKIGKNQHDWSAYFFAGLNQGKGCDLFDLICVEGDKVLHRFIVPSTSAKVLCLTISDSAIAGTGKYSPYLNATHLLDF